MSLKRPGVGQFYVTNYCDSAFEDSKTHFIHPVVPSSWFYLAREREKLAVRMLTSSTTCWSIVGRLIWSELLSLQLGQP